MQHIDELFHRIIQLKCSGCHIQIKRKYLKLESPVLYSKCAKYMGFLFQSNYRRNNITFYRHLVFFDCDEDLQRQGVKLVRNVAFRQIKIEKKNKSRKEFHFIVFS